MRSIGVQWRDSGRLGWVRTTPPPYQKHRQWLKESKLISKVHYRVEQFLGTLKRTLGFRRASYMGTNKVKGQMVLKSICTNLLKAANKISLIPEQHR